MRGERKKVFYKVSTLTPPLAMDGLTNQHGRHTAGVLGCPVDLNLYRLAYLHASSTVNRYQSKLVLKSW